MGIRRETFQIDVFRVSFEVVDEAIFGISCRAIGLRRRAMSRLMVIARCTPIRIKKLD